jgi:hypothetical protein
MATPEVSRSSRSRSRRSSSGAKKSTCRCLIPLVRLRLDLPTNRGRWVKFMRPVRTAEGGKRLHHPPGETGRWLRKVVQGWLNYHAIPGNFRCLEQFATEVKKLWLQALLRRSHKGSGRWTWVRFQNLIAKHLPNLQILHPYPHTRFRARLQARAI